MRYRIYVNNILYKLSDCVSFSVVLSSNFWNANTVDNNCVVTNKDKVNNIVEMRLCWTLIGPNKS